ncbi:LrgB family protein [Planococcus sp. CAU13]|uniref:LrgB family protein n=1 Tax=Planococcus sp. CAU13 TaxID=1541197 RepID=UPI00052FF617|nr:LrgB family protein [Planococcus sp. CAU13]
METLTLAVFFIALTAGAYFGMNLLYIKFHYSILMPALTATLLVILFLLLTETPYDTYMIGGQWIDRILGPAVVALAIPLYKQRKLLFDNLVPIFTGTLVGVSIGLFTGFALAKLFGFSEVLVLSLLPKSITSPVAMEIAEQIGGIPSLAAVFVMIAGFSGIIIGPAFLRVLRIETPIGLGMGFGASAHGIGTAKALEYGPREASVSSVAMSLSAVFGSFLAPVLVWLFFL